MIMEQAQGKNSQLIGGAKLREKVKKNKVKRIKSKVAIYSFHLFFLLVVAVGIYFGSYIGAGAIFLLWVAFILST